MKTSKAVKGLIKRSSDIFISLVVLLLLMPVMIMISLMILISMGPPVIFSQLRPGYKGKPFKLFKFRSMRTAYDKNGILLPDGQRLTFLGKILRNTSLDELPEIINVLKGDMSLVGPRPLLMHYLPLYNSEQMMRHDVKPGITGWAQVNGRNAIDWEEKFRLDLWYVNNQSPGLDLKIILLTLLAMFTRKGINQPGHATTEEFKGGF